MHAAQGRHHAIGKAEIGTDVRAVEKRPVRDDADGSSAQLPYTSKDGAEPRVEGRFTSA